MGEIEIPEGSVEILRDRLWRRSEALQVTEEESAGQFLDEVGACLGMGHSQGGLPSMWVATCGERSPATPKHTHSDPNLGLCWRLKNSLVDEGRAFYGRYLRKKPSYISLSWLSTFIAAKEEKELSEGAARVLEVLRESGALATDRIRRDAGFPDRKSTTKAIDELQETLLVTKVAEQAEPFTFIWDLVEVTFPISVEKAATISAASARKKLVVKLLSTMVVATKSELRSALQWSGKSFAPVIKALVDDGKITDSLVVGSSTGLLAWMPTLEILQSMKP